VTPLQPVTINVVSMAGGDFSRGDRIELTAATGCSFDVELQGQ